MKIYSYQPKTEANNQALRPRKKSIFKGLKANPRKIFTWVFRLGAGAILLVALMFLYYSHNLPDPNKLLDRQVPESTKIFARDGSLLYEIHGEYKRTLVGLNQISPFLKNATVAVEDKDFYKHGGISFTGIARAIIVDVLTGKKTQGGSTITQQFVKKAILTDDKSWDRKIRELILAVAIDSRFTKDQILKLYLNEIPYGRNAYGIEAASQSYFNKSAKDLTLAESAYLAALPQAPTFYNPLGPNRQSLDNRKNTILALMQQQGYISQEQAKQSQGEKVEFSQITNGIKAPHFVFMVQDYLAGKYGEKTLEEGGLKVYTTLDPRLQDIAEKVVKADADKESKKYNVGNAALVAIDPKTGQVLALVGSKDYFGTAEPAGCIPGKTCVFEPNFNAAAAPRQPGSSFKPYAYVTAFGRDFKYNPASMLIDVTTDFGKFGNNDYIPHNYNGQSYGPLSMRQTLAGSLNVPAVKTLALIGVENATKTAHDLGITSPLADCGLSLVLGGCEVKLVDHVAAFSVFANGGIKNDKTFILKIEDRTGNELESYQSSPKQILDPQANYELVNIMSDNNARSFIFGANSPLILPGRPVAAKTGTTQNWHDGWTIGFTPSLAAGVWAGNNDGEFLKKNADGVVVAAPIWHDFMAEALAGTPAEDFPVPPGIQKISVDSVSGKLPTQYTPTTKTEIFADYSVPTDYDNVHIGLAIDSLTGQPATTLTPPGQITTTTYTVFHSEKPDLPNWEEPVVSWALGQGYQYPPGSGIGQLPPPPQPGNGAVDVNILEPADGATVSKLPLKVAVSATSQNQIARVDLSIDGQFIQSLTSQPFVFSVNNSLSEGQHTLAVKAVDSSGATADSSVSVNYSLNTPIILTEPTQNITANFPLTLIAESSNYYNQVSFYYLPDKGSAKLIGFTSNIAHAGEVFDYSVSWTQKPDAGTYKVYAQTSSGLVTPKVKIIVP